MFTADATKLTNEVKDKLPGDAKEIKKDAQVAGQDAKTKADQLARDARAGADKVDARLESLRRDAGKELDKAAESTRKNVNEAADKFDKNVTEVSCCLHKVLGWVGRCVGQWLILCVFVLGRAENEEWCLELVRRQQVIVFSFSLLMDALP